MREIKRIAKEENGPLGHRDSSEIDSHVCRPAWIQGRMLRAVPQGLCPERHSVARGVVPMTEDDLRRSVLKVVSPYEGSAFLAGPGRDANHWLVVSCHHVCVQDPPRGQPLGDIPPVEFKYIPAGKTTPVTIYGQYLPNESDCCHDIAVVEVALPAGLAIPPVSLDTDYLALDHVVALGFPAGQPELLPVEGGILNLAAVRRVSFEDLPPRDPIVDVLRIDTRGIRGFFSDGVIRGGMSGGPILNSRTGAVMAIIEGRRPRGGDDVPPEGYGLEVKHLAACSARLRPLIRDRAYPSDEHRPESARGADHATWYWSAAIFLAAVVSIFLIVGMIWALLTPLTMEASFKGRYLMERDLKDCEASPCAAERLNSSALTVRLNRRGYACYFVEAGGSIVGRRAVLEGSAAAGTVDLEFPGENGTFTVVVTASQKAIECSDTSSAMPGEVRLPALFAVGPGQ